ncbi:MAG: DinB family protein [Acidobacteria bacterium]|nr:DinB family protein [Acidobacteriota bacterium]
MRKISLKAPLALCAFLALPLAAAEYDWKADFAKHWKSSIAFTNTVAEMMPEEGYSYIPPSTAKPVERNYAGQIIHIGRFNAGMFALVTGMKPPETPPQGTTDKATVLKYLKETAEFCDKALPAVTEEQLSKTVKVGKYEMTGRDALEGAYAHMAHTRGQCEVYLRLKNITPPPYPFE